jgi:hypothetical protein
MWLLHVTQGTNKTRCSATTKHWLVIITLMSPHNENPQQRLWRANKTHASRDFYFEGISAFILCFAAWYAAGWRLAA